MTTMLTVEGLTVRYGRVAALTDVSLTVESGELVGVIGPNGAGKSTLLLTIAGALSPSAGTIVFNGEVVGGETPEGLVRRGIALVPERRHIFGSLSVGENLRLGMTTRRDRRAASEDLERSLERFPILKTRLRSAASTLSGGEQQQLALARSLMTAPKLFLVDEPSLGLAPRMVDLVFDVLEELRREGVTTLLVEQNAARTIDIADRVYVLRTGSVTLTGAGPGLLAGADLSGIYLGN